MSFTITEEHDTDIHPPAKHYQGNPLPKELRANIAKYSIKYESGDDLSFITFQISDVIRSGEGRQILYRMQIDDNDTHTSTKTIVDALGIDMSLFDIGFAAPKSHAEYVGMYRAYRLFLAFHAHIRRLGTNVSLETIINEVKSSIGYRSISYFEESLVEQFLIKSPIGTDPFSPK